jgi:2-(1,2-epoxy-1,2-dihydrophenyl)acetyl-CoA isomerase
LSRALDFVMRKRIVEASEAKEIGLVHEVVPAVELEATAMAWATEFATGPQVAMRMLKRSMYNAAEQSWAHALEDIAARTAITDHHPDTKEGVAAFREKRTPHFNAWLEPNRD